MAVHNGVEPKVFRTHSEKRISCPFFINEDIAGPSQN